MPSRLSLIFFFDFFGLADLSASSSEKLPGGIALMTSCNFSRYFFSSDLWLRSIDRRDVTNSCVGGAPSSGDVNVFRIRAMGPLAKYASDVLDMYMALRYWSTRVSSCS